MKMKAANGDWSIIHKELKTFMSTYGEAKGPAKHLVHSKSDSSEPLKIAPSGKI